MLLGTSRRWTATTVLTWTAAIVVLVRIWLGVSLPLSFLPQASADDGLYMSHAASLLSGNWLGPFNQDTLAKGPGYPLFLAFGSLTGLPISLMHALFQVFAIGLVAWAIFRATRYQALSLALFILLALHPAGFAAEMERVIRDQIYWAQALIVVALFAIVLLSPFRSRWVTGAISIVAGLCLGWTWLTREEGVWLLPGLLVLVAGAFLIDWKKAGLTRAKLLNLFLAFLGFALVQASFMTINRLEYGSFVAVGVKERNFVRALDALQSVQIGKMPYVPVSNDAIIAIGMAASAFAPLALELIPGGRQSGWEKWGCQIYPTTCDQIAGGWFMWALRDAAADNGYFEMPAVASRIFGDIADEVEAACADGKLPCRASPIAFMPPLSSSQLAAIPSSLLAVISKIGFWNIPLSSVQGASQYPDWGSAAQGMWSLINYPKIFDGRPGPAEFANSLRNGLIFVFRIAMPLLTGAGLILFVVSLRNWRHRATQMLVLIVGTAWVFVLTRVAVLTLIDISAFPAANLLYGAPAVYLLSVATALSIALPFVGRGSHAVQQQTAESTAEADAS